MSRFMVHHILVSIDGRIFGFVIGTADGIKLGIIKITNLGSLIGSSKIYKDRNIGVSLNIIDQRYNCTFKY